MNEAKRLYVLIEKVRGKLQAEGIEIENYDKAIECLSKTVSPKLCIDIYEKYLYY